MPIEKTPNFIRIRVASPKLFIRFRIKTLGKGIKAVIGFKKGGGSQIQSLLFSRTKWTLKTAKAWVKKHKYKVEESFWVDEILIDPETKELVLEETVATDDEEVPEINIKEIKEDVFAWLIE